MFHSGQRRSEGIFDNSASDTGVHEVWGVDTVDGLHPETHAPRAQFCFNNEFSHVAGKKVHIVIMVNMCVVC